MTKYVALSATLVVLLATGPGLASGPICRRPALSDAQILEIVKSDIEKRGGSFDIAKYRYRVDREDCRYSFFAEKPDERGNHFAVSIDERGKIVKRFSGR